MTNVRRTTEAESRAGEKPNPLRGSGREGEVPPTLPPGVDPENLPPGTTITETEAGTELRHSTTVAENAKVERKRQAGLEAQRQARIEGITPPPTEPEPPPVRDADER